MTKIQIALVTVGIIGCGLVAARVAFPLPSLENRTPGDANQGASKGALAEQLAKSAAANPGKSGLFPLQDAAASFAARVLMVRSAEHTIDTQYYIWHDDLTGIYLLDELRQAAERGVKVRMLLDDNGIAVSDKIMSQLNAHPNIEVRLYNPFTTRSFKQAGYAFDFTRLNRRMHNKSLTVDGLATLGGGRNIGDEYFGTGEQPAFLDLDLLATGAVVQDVSDDFASYWNSQSAFPFDLIVKQTNETEDLLAPVLAAVSEGPQRAEYEQEIAQNDTVQKLTDGTLPLEWTQAILVSDPPRKTLGKASDESLMLGQLESLMGEIGERVDIISPYFVPGDAGTQHLISLAKRGVRVRVLTNAMEATDVLAVHAGYAAYRRELLEGGVELFELKASAAPDTKRSDAGLAGSSGSSLHAKSFAVDGKRIYIGSFNFDPRSFQLNTEMGMLVDSTEMAGTLHDGFDGEIASAAYAVSLNDDGDIIWTEQGADGEEGSVYTKDPHSSALARGGVTILSWLPIQWML